MRKIKMYCQSCGMLLRNSDDYGTDIVGKKTMEYCKNCFSQGAFTEPDITMAKMIERVAVTMSKQMRMDIREAVNIAVALIPKLKRWQ